MRLQNHANNTGSSMHNGDVYVHTSTVLTTPNRGRLSASRRFAPPEIHVTTDSITIEDFPYVFPFSVPCPFPTPFSNFIFFHLLPHVPIYLATVDLMYPFFCDRSMPARAMVTRKSKLNFDLEHDAEYEK